MDLRTRPLILPYTGDKAVTVSASIADAGGVPTRQFRKDVIRVGSFVKASDGISFEVTADTLNHWAATFSEMQADGVRVPLLSDHIEDADHARGTIDALFVDGDRLIAKLTAVGEAAITAALSNDVSIFSPPQQQAGNGKTYTRPIQHIALTPRPVITGLGPTVAVAASNGTTTQADVVKLADSTTPPENKTMDLTKIKAAMGIEDELTEANAEEMIIAAFGKLKGALDEAKKTAVEASQKAAAVAASNTAKKPDPMLVSLASDNYKMKLDGLVACSAITPAVRDNLAKTFIGDGNTDALTLSLTNGSQSTIDRVIESLKGNDPVKLGEQSKAQTLALSDSRRDGTAKNPVGDAIARRFPAAAAK